LEAYLQKHISLLLKQILIKLKTYMYSNEYVFLFGNRFLFDPKYFIVNGNNPVMISKIINTLTRDTILVILEANFNHPKQIL
jgi:hypothetical protein